MTTVDKIYINGEFVIPHGTETFELLSPVNHKLLGKVILADATDAQRAIAAAKEAFASFRFTTRKERIEYLERIAKAMSVHKQELIDIMILEYGAPLQFATASFLNAVGAIRANISLLQEYSFSRKIGTSTVIQTPVGVAGIITPWNASNSFICSKLSAAIAAGCTAVIKPSEFSALQTQVISQCLHEAGLPKGVVNIVTGLGTVVGEEITLHPDVAKISFTGSTATGKTIAKNAAETMKRITLELGGKSPNIILNDADLPEVIKLSVTAAFMNSGQACIAASRLLVPEDRLEEIKPLLIEAVSQFKVGDPRDADTSIGPLLNEKQYNKVQDYIRSGIEEGAEILTGGLGKPEGLEDGNFVKPTVFIHVSNTMRIAREEIFGPVLSVITYRNEEEAVSIANDTRYGLAAYIQGRDAEKAKRIAARIDAGRVSVNSLSHDPNVPFGGFKQSGIGREYGVYGLESYLEPKAILE